MFKVRLCFRIRLSMIMHYLYSVFMHFLLKLSYLLFRMGWRYWDGIAVPLIIRGV